ARERPSRRPAGDGSNYNGRSSGRPLLAPERKLLQPLTQSSNTHLDGVAAGDRQAQPDPVATRCALHSGWVEGGSRDHRDTRPCGRGGSFLGVPDAQTAPDVQPTAWVEISLQELGHAVQFVEQ